MTPNVGAFLAMLRHSEGTDRAPDPYRVCYRYRHYVVDMSDHPAVTGEWNGERITQGKYAGDLSTAAGAYQFNRPTWLEMKMALRLTDFSAGSQDDACIELIKRCGALDYVNAGFLPEAVEKCSSRWASLPGSTSGQPQAKYAALADLYTYSGGSLA